MFSVILPTYNRAGTVLEAVASVLAQTRTDFELIVVDDRSTDDTQAVLARIEDPRVTVVINDRSKGEGGARNKGIFLAQAPWICQIDSDDLWPSDWLELLAAAIAQAPADVGVVYGSLEYLDTRTGRVRTVRRAEKAGHVYRQLLADHSISHCSAAMRAEDLRAIGGYDETFTNQADSDLLLRLTRRRAVLPVPEAVYVVREGGEDRLMAANHQSLLGLEQLFEKYAGDLSEEPTARYQQLANILDLAINEGDSARIARIWPKLVPSIWETPSVGREFLREQRRLGDLAVRKAKWRFLNLVNRFWQPPHGPLSTR
jgi:glycosyltransferase involved in cell wall biosynthesis